jgi:hypothetical protein
MTSFTDVLDRYGVPYRTEGHEHCREGWVQIDCPFCSPGWEHFRMGYNLAFGAVNCYACGRHSTVSVLHEVTGEPYAVCKALLEGLVDEFDLRPERPRGRLKLPEGVGPLLKAHRKYLRGRGFDPDYLEQFWKVGGLGRDAGYRSEKDGEWKDLAWRVFIPVTSGGQVVSWTTRSLTDKARYRSAEAAQEAVPHKDLLYGEDHCTHTILVHEGPTDVWASGPPATCTFGTQYTRAQVLRMVRYPRRVICYDDLPDAQEQARGLASELAPFPGETLNVRLGAKDSASASEKLRKKLRRLLK